MRQCFTDVMPPTIKCPDDITMIADDGEGTAEVTWDIPVAVDNSGFIPTVTVIPAVVPPTRIPIGPTEISYSAEDTFSNTASCTFNVIVQGTVNFIFKY